VRLRSCGVIYDTRDMPSMISSQQIRAARALLGISAFELAEQSGVSHRTIQRFEGEEGIPESRLGNLAAIERALTELGIMFVGDPIESPGVQLRRHHEKPETSS